MFWLLAVIGVLLVSIWTYLHNRNQLFKRLGVPGPKPMLLFGNLLDMENLSGFQKKSAKAPAEVFAEWTKQFGKVFGYYEGGSPVFVSSDPDFVMEVFVKQFSNFHGRKLMVVSDNPDTDSERTHMFYARGIRWKRLRTISSPAFSQLKIKQMFPIVIDCVEEFMRIVRKKQETGQPVDIHKLFQGMTMDAIARTCFGYESSVQSNPNQNLAQVCRTVLGNEKPLIQSLLLLGAFVMPEFRYKIAYLTFKLIDLLKLPYVQVLGRLAKVVEQRKKMKPEPNAIKDFIQLLLEAETTETDFQIGSTAKVESFSNSLSVEKKLTSKEVVNQCFLFLAAGFETTSASLAFASFALAKHPEVQEKLYQEMIEITSNGENVSYDTLQKANYLDMVLNETLRLYPVGHPGRTCMNSCTVNGVPIPEGTFFWVDVITMHRNEEYWGPDASEFKPERFAPELCESRHPTCFIPFGAGPRNCIGQRFALLEAKLALTRVLLEFKINLADNFSLKLKSNPAGINPEKVVLMLEKRTQPRHVA